MNEKEDDIETALSGIFSKELIEKIKNFKRNRAGEINQAAMSEFVTIFEQAANEKSELRDILTSMLGRDLAGAMNDIMNNPSEEYANAQFEKMINSKRTKKLMKSLLPKEFSSKLLDSGTPFDFFMNFTEIGRLAFNGVTEEYSDYTNNCRLAIDELQKDLLSDIERIKTRVDYVKRIENFRDAISLLGSYKDIFLGIKELSHWKNNVNLQYIKETALPVYLDLATKYEMVAKFVLIDIEICEGRFNPNDDYMQFSLGKIVKRISSSARFSILADVDTIVRNSLAHGGKYYPTESNKTIRFFDKNCHEDLSYLEIIDKTCRLASVFYVVLSYLEEGHKKEFQMVRDKLAGKKA